jgi:excisionase family DNA binding protein
MENTITLKTNDLLTVDQFARDVGHPRITVYRWIERHKINSITIGKTLYIPTSELKPHFVIKKCTNCYHEKHEDGTKTCACREISDMEDGCKDWVWKWTYN